MKLVAKLIILLLIVAGFASADSFVISPIPACSGSPNGFNGANASQAFTNPSETEASTSDFLFNTGNTGGNVTFTITVFITTSAYVSGFDETNPPTFSSSWLRWVNISAYTSGLEDSAKRALFINWSTPSVTTNATGPHFGFLGTTFGGDNTITATEDHRFLNIHSTKITNGNWLIWYGSSCVAYNGYLVESVTNSTSKMLRPYFLNTTLPGAPSVPLNLVGTAGKFRVDLNWDTPTSGPTLGYYVYREDTVSLTPTLLANVTVSEYADLELPCTGIGYNYSVSAYNSAGEGPATDWTGFLYPTCRSGTLFGGDNAQIYGPGGSVGLGESLGISGTAAAFLWGFIILLLLTMLGFLIYGLPGSVIGAIVGLILVTAWGMFPLWSVLFLVGVSAAAFFIIPRSG